jgi:predicted RND superfamily exporter protein
MKAPTAGTSTIAPIKFQADMGILLTFMFLWNMIGAIVLLPALGAFIIKVKPNQESCKANLQA